jgi:hypothetical protein
MREVGEVPFVLGLHGGGEEGAEGGGVGGGEVEEGELGDWHFCFVCLFI